MAYVKLDTGILDSTLWMDRVSREVFITALLMAVPHEVTEDTETLAIRSPEPTGFVVPPGWYGRVPAAGVGIARRAGIEPEDGLDALERLSGPDAESRTPDFDGRRLVRVDGGFIVLNFMRYRDRDTTAAERQQRYRERKKNQKPRVTRNGDGVTRNVTQAVSSKQEEVRSKKKADTAEEEPAHIGAIADPDQRAAYLRYRKAHRSPLAFDASLKAIQSGMRGRAFEWPTLGAALMAMESSEVKFSERALMGFARKLVEAGPDGSSGRSTLELMEELQREEALRDQR